MFDLFFPTNTDFKVFRTVNVGGRGIKLQRIMNIGVVGSIAETDKQNNVSGGIFHRAYGTHVYISGQFRNFGKYVVNYGKSYAMNEKGAYNEFVVQELTANPSETQVLGMTMSFVFENVNAGSGVTLDDSSYFYIEKVQTI